MFSVPVDHRVARTSHLFITIPLCLFLVLVLPVFVRGQAGTDSIGTGGKNKIQGRIYFPSGRRSDATAVKVVLESTSSDRLSVIADLNGSFTFDALSPGSYSIVVDAGHDYETARESVVIDGTGIRSRTLSGPDLARASMPRTYNVIITLRLKPIPGARTGVVDASLASVPKAALDQYQKALESAQAGDRARAIDQLKAALSYYPEFALARNELGVQYLKLGNLDKAIEAFRSALTIRPDDATIRLNFGVALLEKNNFSESEAQLRQAIARNDNLATAHLYLGIVLIKLRQYDDAQKELERAASLARDSMSLAHYYLGGILWRKKQYKRAADELETYLKLAPNAHDAESLRATIRELRSKEAATPFETPETNKVKSVRTPG